MDNVPINLKQEQFEKFLDKAFNVKKNNFEIIKKELSENRLKLQYSVSIKGSNALFVLEAVIEDNEKYIETEKIYRKFKNRLNQVYGDTHKRKFVEIIQEISNCTSTL